MIKLNCWMKACTLLLLSIATAISLPAQTLTTLYSFGGTDGDEPQAALVQVKTGAFYGTTSHGGANGDGTVFKITPDGTLTTVHNFNGADGGSPLYALIQATDGNLYGTTFNGGSSTACDGGCGTVFKMTLDGTVTTLHSFNGADGANPFGGLVEGSNGLFYGTVIFGGSNGGGTVYTITAAGALRVVHNFAGAPRDGSYPYPALIQATDGNFYGTTFSGGGADEGTVFRLTPSGTLTTIHAFCLAGIPCPDGGNVQSGLVQATNGNLYGMVARGGSTTCTFNGYDGCGTIFEITLSGTLTTLHLFQLTDGGQPVARLIQATNGNLYGVTPYGGTSSACAGGCGTIFQITPSGTFTSLYSFCSASGCTDGSFPAGNPIQGTNGVMYGTTGLSGVNGDGTIYGIF